MKTFETYTIKNMELRNRVILSPMCMHSSDDSGNVNDFHLVHYASRAMGGTGLIIVEAAGVTQNGRITDSDLGIWKDRHAEGLSFLVKEVKKYGSKIALQLNHSGRKYTGNSGEPVAPSAIAFDKNSKVPKELSIDEIHKIILAFKDAAKRADNAGFDALEIHAAHGYLINEFLSPLSNLRNDEYGGNTENRTRFLKEILEAVHEVWPKEKPILLRVSADDYKGQDGITCGEMIKIINIIKDLVDVVDVSSGGLVPAEIKKYPGYQVKLSEEIKHQCDIPTIAVGLITELNMIEEILSNDRADLVALGRELLRNPYFLLNEAKNRHIDIDFPEPYKIAFK